MPYRRLPNTDAARVRAMSAAISKSMQLPPDQLAFSYKTLQKTKYFISTFKQSLAHKNEGNTDKSEKGSTFNLAQKKARLYISHFIQVLNFAILREELLPEVREFYGLQKLGKKLPSLETDEEIIGWGKNIIQGEDARAAKGGTPIQNPRIALVKMHYDKFLIAQRNKDVIDTRSERAIEYVNELRTEADKIILEIWNEVEAAFESLEPPVKRAKAEEYGLKYVFRKSELKNNE